MEMWICRMQRMNKLHILNIEMSVIYGQHGGQEAGR